MQGIDFRGPMAADFRKRAFARAAEILGGWQELGHRSADRVADLRRPGQVILRLARDGFGVLLEGA